MTYNEAINVRKGDTMYYRGQPHVVTGISSRGIAAPHFHLSSTDIQGKFSYQLCSLTMT